MNDISIYRYERRMKITYPSPRRTHLFPWHVGDILLAWPILQLKRGGTQNIGGFLRQNPKLRLVFPLSECSHEVLSTSPQKIRFAQHQRTVFAHQVAHD